MSGIWIAVLCIGGNVLGLVLVAWLGAGGGAGGCFSPRSWFDSVN